uniref:Uncharacterized protein n=1 Tax=Tetranychus urticae TaxID=32264 RepID=T1JWZ0_TETUR
MQRKLGSNRDQQVNGGKRGKTDEWKGLVKDI